MVRRDQDDSGLSTALGPPRQMGKDEGSRAFASPSKRLGTRLTAREEQVNSRDDERAGYPPLAR